MYTTKMMLTRSPKVKVTLLPDNMKQWRPDHTVSVFEWNISSDKKLGFFHAIYDRPTSRVLKYLHFFSLLITRCTCGIQHPQWCHQVVARSSSKTVYDWKGLTQPICILNMNYENMYSIWITLFLAAISIILKHNKIYSAKTETPLFLTYHKMFYFLKDFVQTCHKHIAYYRIILKKSEPCIESCLQNAVS